MMDFVATFQHWLTLACFVALAVCLFALAVLCAIPELTDAIRRFCGMDNLSKVVCGVCIVGAVLYGGSKGVNVRWDDGLRDNGTLITNDTVAVRWTYSGIPGASSVFIDYREAGTTNNWLNLAETLANAQEWTGTLANATNYDYWVYSTYVPPVPVHTNGVWVGQAYETKAKVGAAAFLILNGKVVADGRTIAPPKWAEPDVSTASDYVQDGLVAIWDCVENRGWGDGDISETGWTELVSGNVTQTAGRGTFSATAFKMSAANKLELVSNNFRTLTARTVEVVFSDSYGSAGNRVYVEDNNANVGFSLQSNTSNCRLTCNLGNTHQNEVPYSEIARAAPLFCHWALSQSNTSTLYVNGGERRRANKSFTPFTSIGLGLRTNIQADYCCVRVYSRALTAEEIAHNYNIDKRRFNLP